MNEKNESNVSHTLQFGRTADGMTPPPLSSHDRFFVLLTHAPRIRELWDQDKRELKVELFEQALGVMSSGEVCLAQFFASIWFNDNKRYGFDLADAVAKLDPEERALIVEWLADPFWP